MKKNSANASRSSRSTYMLHLYVAGAEAAASHDGGIAPRPGSGPGGHGEADVLPVGVVAQFPRPGAGDPPAVVEVEVPAVQVLEADAVPSRRSVSRVFSMFSQGPRAFSTVASCTPVPA
ncbi:hypothetical protein SMICM17S_02284 [Streptomyces microflavus]